MATDPKDIQLSREQRQLLAERADETGKPWSELLDDFLVYVDPRVVASSNGRTMYEAFAEKGLIGCVHSRTGDLSTNPKHMDGFGKDAWPSDTD